MSQRTLGILQWVGLLLGAGIWAAQHLVGLGITQAACGPNGSTWGVQNDVWQGALMGVALALVLVAEIAAVTVFARTRDVSYDDGPLPGARLHFFATASIFANAIFLIIIVLDATASIAAAGCRQA
jgi:hypothetical protein